jgi:hypothetical protein
MQNTASIGTDRVVELLLQGRGPARDVRAIAYVCGLELCPHRGGEPRLVDRELHYDGTVPRSEQQRSIAQCVALWACKRYGLPATAENVAIIARALTGA